MEKNRQILALTKNLLIAVRRLSGDGLALSVSLRSPRPGCGSQRLLRCRSHPAGRGPNSSSLFPPLALGLRLLLFLQPLGGALKKQNAALASPPFICRWQRSAPLQSSPLPPKGEPLAKPFTLRGLPKPPLGRGGGTASAVTERLSPAAAHGQALS